MVRSPHKPKSPAAKRTGHIAPNVHERREPPSNNRLFFGSASVVVQAWPSRGGVIVLKRATGVDFHFLGLDTQNLQTKRDPDQRVEDRLCQQLLLLGATWFDNEERRSLAAGLEEDDEESWQAVEAGEVAPLTKQERRWVSVGWEEEASGGGGLWVVEYDAPMYGGYDRSNVPPSDASKVTLARTMEEKCGILKRMPGARYFSSLDKYDGEACLRAWQNKTSGEHGPLQQMRYEAS